MKMENNIRDHVPYIVYESSMARQERTIKRLIIALVFAVVLMFTSNALWLLAWSSYDYVSTETTTTETNIDSHEGTANYIGNDGDIINGNDTREKDNGSDEEPDEENIEQ